ncbi:MAG: GWxTD domain-containing protein [bacterium]|nr:GWxTD domain-containing protein [bacterium]
MLIKKIIAHNLKIGFLLILFCICFIMLRADVVYSQQFGSPVFYWDIVAVNSPDEGMSRIYLYFKSSFDALTFVRDEDAFKARYEISVVINDDDGYQVDGKVWQEEIVADSYGNTKSRRMFSITYEKFDLPAQEYNVSVKFMDKETGQTREEDIKVMLRDFQKQPLAISDLAVVRNLKTDSLGVKSFMPDVGNFIVDISKDIFGYFEIYNRSKSDDNYDISYSIVNAKGKAVYKTKYKREFDGPRTLDYFLIPTADLSQGVYTLKMRVKQGSEKQEIAKRLVVRWIDLPATIEDVDLAIQQVKYIADKNEWNRLKKADDDEKLDEFKAFWKKRDPSPGTRENEWMDEYYRRIAYANAKFGGFREGWKSDMGMIFIIFGPPSDIERHPFDSGSKPYEIWYYYSINKQFVFMDETGFGEYRLLTRSWEDWRHLIRH